MRADKAIKKKNSWCWFWVNVLMSKGIIILLQWWISPSDLY